MNLPAPLPPAEQAHCRRTAALSELLAKLAGLPDSEVRTVTQSALVHDIGKTAIPPAILGKTGPLTEEEHAIMRMHTAIGAHILIHTHGAMRTASAVALQHHERLDGSGYLGLRGNEIHPHSKLVAVADVFDALLSPRPYKRPWSIRRTCDYLSSLAGVKLDAKLVGLLLDHLPQALALRHEEIRIRSEITHSCRLCTQGEGGDWPMLLQEEQYIIHWLTEYGALTKTQVVRMLKDKPPQTAEKIIRGLKRDVLLYDISGGYYLGVDPMCQPDPRMILAVWVLLQFIDKVEPMAHYPATYPSQIFFLKEDIGYEIVVLYDGEQHLARLLQPQEDLRYIFVLPHIRMAQELVLPSVPCLFATVDYNGQEVPDVRFYTESEGGRDGAV